MHRAYTACQTPEPRFSFCVVTKRISTRLFEMCDGGRNVTNPTPGTVVDNVITCPERYADDEDRISNGFIVLLTVSEFCFRRYDFFLVPQVARQGTVSPTSFNVLVDTSGLDADRMQRFTFKLCHLYFNWSGTVAVPAPCQYAHKLALLSGTALGREANDRLAHFLHFL
jgi:aubergine-like protein